MWDALASFISTLIIWLVIIYLIYIAIKTLLLPELKRKRKLGKPRVVELYVGGVIKKPSFCKLDIKHVHYRVTDIIKHDGEEHEIVYHYCPLTHRIFIVKPKPITPDEIKYGRDFEAKSNSAGE